MKLISKIVIITYETNLMSNNNSCKNLNKNLNAEKCIKDLCGYIQIKKNCIYDTFTIFVINI